jgi:hypothetical protein
MIFASRTSHSLRTFLSNLTSLAAVIFLFVLTTSAQAQESFKTADEGFNALVNAARAGDPEGILAILGPDGADIVSSGDPVADAETLQRFLAAYDERHEVSLEKDNTAIMIIGPADFAFPIPLIQKDGRWWFDTVAGRREILYRRIGRNELDAIQTTLAYVDAQEEYADKDRTGAGVGVYAQRIVSRAGEKDGLYWPAAEGDEASPLGALVAEATRAGYRVTGGRAPYHGYFYRVLTRQGADAPGGAIDYVVNGKMIGGFALVAHPAQYGNSGVMTFLVNHEGVVFQKDLGPRTTEIARAMSEFNPDRSWQKAEVAEP